jgi:hypothetical protein
MRELKTILLEFSPETNSYQPTSLQKTNKPISLNTYATSIPPTSQVPTGLLLNLIHYPRPPTTSTPTDFHLYIMISSKNFQITVPQPSGIINSFNPTIHLCVDNTVSYSASYGLADTPSKMLSNSFTTTTPCPLTPEIMSFIA